LRSTQDRSSRPTNRAPLRSDGDPDPAILGCIYLAVTLPQTAAAPMNTSRVFHAATLLPNGKVLVTGGQVDAAWTASAEVYDPAANTWSAAPP
jgi:hypothetical protein